MIDHEPELCKCGREVAKVEVRIVKRCAQGHVVGMTMSAPPIAPEQFREPITDGQIRALNGKAGAIDKLEKLRPGTTKKHALESVGATSTKQLDARHASELLDRLEARLESLR